MESTKYRVRDLEDTVGRFNIYLLSPTREGSRHKAEEIFAEISFPIFLENIK